MSTLQGRRRPDQPPGHLPDDIQPGDYWRPLAKDGQPERADHPGNLTGAVWVVVAPNHDTDRAWMMGRLELHTVREHEDGTISVRPGDGSSNSILITGRWQDQETTWHGYIDHGVWQGC